MKPASLGWSAEAETLNTEHWTFLLAETVDACETADVESAADERWSGDAILA